MIEMVGMGSKGFEEILQALHNLLETALEKHFWGHIIPVEIFISAFSCLFCQLSTLANVSSVHHSSATSQGQARPLATLTYPATCL